MNPLTASCVIVSWLLFIWTAKTNCQTPEPIPTPTPDTSGTDVCNMSADSGKCFRNMKRWHYNAATKVCETFLYSGCGGNPNRFDTRNECRKACMPGSAPIVGGDELSPPDNTTKWQESSVCDLNINEGKCQGKYQRWGYDTYHMQCVSFVYTGCRGNDNRFDSEYDCNYFCGSKKIHPSIDNCSQAVTAGPCSAEHWLWYYDVAKDACHFFKYGGCYGNGNRYPSETECMRRCSPRYRLTEPPQATTEAGKSSEDSGKEKGPDDKDPEASPKVSLKQKTKLLTLETSNVLDLLKKKKKRSA